MRSLPDTNLLVYADAADEPAKQRRAIQVIRQQRAAGTAVLYARAIDATTDGSQTGPNP